MEPESQVRFTIDLSFVSDDRLRRLAEDYYRQAVAAYGAGAYLGTVVICGGVAEGLLTWAVSLVREEAEERHPGKPIEEWDLTRLISVATDLRLLGITGQFAAWAVKEFRNFIHPYNLLRKGTSARADNALALNSLSSVMEISRSLRNHRLRGALFAREGEAGVLDLDLAARMMNFSWVVNGMLAGCRGPRSGSDLRTLRQLGVSGLVRLAERDEVGVTSNQVQAVGIEDCHLPTRDYTAPDQAQIDSALLFIESQHSRGNAVAVSCGAGYGRTGTILACYLVSRGRSADDAISHLIGLRPQSEEVLNVPGQREAIIEFQVRSSANL